MHDSALPSTSDCPYLPGQTVNTLWVPVEQSLRQRSASLNSMRDTDLKTMNPKDKFTTPRPAPSHLPTLPARRLATAPSIFRHQRSARSLSPGSNWSFSPRKLFSRKASSSSLRESEEVKVADTPLYVPCEDVRIARHAGEGSRSRDISPESLRRFLINDTPLVAEPDLSERPSLAIPEDIAEENEDDDNFATSATLSPLESVMHFTVLSPPPSQHAHSRCTTPTFPSGEMTLTPPSKPQTSNYSRPAPPTRSPPRVPHVAPVIIPSPGPGTSFYDPDLMTPNSPQSTASNDIPSFYNSDDEDEDEAEEDGYPLQALGLGLGGVDSFAGNLGSSLSTYSLPLTSDTITKPVVQQQTITTNPSSPALVCRNGNDVPAGNTSLLTSPIPNSGLDELMNELNWMADFIHGKRN